jgi:tRNA(Arg) A34 adenosine deaminase TadA
LPVLDGDGDGDGDGGRGSSQATPELAWSSLDGAWQEAFRQAWEAFGTRNIAVGACATTADGSIVHAARNRVADGHGPVGEVFGSSLAHAEINVLARLGFRQPRELVLTTTLEPCVQCSAAVRLGPVATVRFAGADPYWDGCHDFSPLSRREAARVKVEMLGPRMDEVGLFGTLISRFGLGLAPRVEEFLRARGEGDSLDLVRDLESSGEVPRLVAMDVREAFRYLWPQLREIRDARQAAGNG